MSLRVVLDTNIVISSLWGGNPRSVIETCQAGRFKALVSLEILKEYQRVLERFQPAEEDMEAFLVLFTSPRHSILVKPLQRHTVIHEDPSDDIFLDCAVTGKASAIISGDQHLLKKKAFSGVPILTPSQALTRLL